MRKHSLIFVSIMLVFFYCGKSNNGTKTISETDAGTDPVISKSDEKNHIDNKSGREEKKGFEIKSAGFVGKAFENNDLQADVKLSIPSDDIELKFRWFINDNLAEQTESDLLPKINFKQGDWVFYKVRIISNGKKSDEMKSNYVRILGTTPILNLVPVPAISIPGEFKYKINASLPGSVPDEEDEDSILDDNSVQNKNLEFSLISPTDLGISIDSSSGEIVWNITESTASSIKDSIEIKFKVSNPSGGSVTSSIKLQFKSHETDKAPTKKKEGI